MAQVNGNLLVKGQLLDLKPETLATDPLVNTLGIAPRLWVNSTDKVLKFFNGAEIIGLGAAGESDGVTEQELLDALLPYAKTLDVTSSIETAVTGLAVATEVTDEIAAAVTGLAKTSEVTSAISTAVTGLAVASEVTEEIGVAVTGLVNTTALQNAIDNALAGLDFQADVVGLESEFVGVAGRYIFEDGAEFTTGVAAAAGDIVTVSATGEILTVAYDVSAAGAGALVWNTTGIQWLRWDGSTWAEFGGLTGFTAGDGIEKTGDVVSVKLDGASLVKGVNGLKVGDLSATYVTPAALATATADFQTEVEVGAIVDAAVEAAAADLATAASVTAVSDKLAGSFVSFVSELTNTTHTVTHGLGFRFPMVQVVDSDTNKSIIPDDISFNTVDELVITLGVTANVTVSVVWLKMA